MFENNNINLFPKLKINILNYWFVNYINIKKIYIT